MELTIKNDTDVKEIAATIEKSILDGEVDKTEAAIFLKRVEKIVELVLESKPIKEQFRIHFERNKKVQAFGALVEYTAVHTAYNYDYCRHPLYNAWKRIAIEAAANMKALEKFLREMQYYEGEIIVEELPKIVYENSGEVVQVFPAEKVQQFGPKFKF